MTGLGSSPAHQTEVLRQVFSLDGTKWALKHRYTQTLVQDDS